MNEPVGEVLEFFYTTGLVTVLALCIWYIAFLLQEMRSPKEEPQEEIEDDN